MGKEKIYIVIVTIIIGLIIILFSNVNVIKFYLSDYHKETKRGYRKTMNHLGNFGEYLIFQRLCKVKGYKKILSNVYIKKRSGDYTEVDVIMVHTSGIYVIESKNYKGHISGYKTAKNWTQSLGRNTKNQFYNPLQQNEAHMRGIKYCLDLPDMSLLHSVIVFSNNSDLSEVHIDESDVIVTNVGCLIKDLKWVMKKNRNMLSEHDVDLIYKKLRQGEYVSKDIKKQQLNHAKERAKKANRNWFFRLFSK
ncbi:MAG: nuclease-related domain-containing protein [Oscillospiraceae bacterium]